MRQISPMEWQLMIVSIGEWDTVHTLFHHTLSQIASTKKKKKIKKKQFHHYTITIALIRIGLSD